jgi:hypothetical protein
MVEAFEDQLSRTCAKPSHLHISAQALHDISPEVSLVSFDKVTRLHLSTLDLSSYRALQ